MKIRNKILAGNLIIAVALVLCVRPAGAQQTGSVDGRRHVLILNSYHKEFLWTDNQVAGAREVLSEAVENLELYVEYLDTKRIYTDEYLEHLVPIYNLKYDKVQLDAIITTDDNALRFVLKHHEDIFQGAPVSFCGINDYSSLSLEGKEQFTGLVEVLDIEATLDLALSLHPETRKVFVVVDNTPTGMGQRKEVAVAARQFGDLKFEYLKGEDYSMDELLEKLQRLPKDSIVLLTVWLRDRNNDYVATNKGGALISAKSSVPVYGIIDMYLGHGIVGGKILNSETHGRTAAEMTVRVLEGEKPADIPVLVQSSNPYMFDEAQLRRWRIDPVDLPEGSIVTNRSFSLYETYRTRIWGVAGFFAFLLVVIAVLVTNIMRRKQAEKALRETQIIFNSFLENSPVYIFFKDSEIRPLMLSKNYEQMLDMPLENILGKTMDELFPSDLAKSMIEDDKRILRKGKALTIVEELGGRTYETTKFPIFVDGKAKILAGFTLDITDRKRAEEEKAKLESQLRQAHKIEAIGTMAGGIAHDFNNILAAIIGYADMARDDIPDYNPAKHQIEQVLKAGNRAKELVRHILTFSRMSGQVQGHVNINLSPIMKEVLKFQRSIIPTTIEIMSDIDENCGQINGDQTQIHQIIMNLCTNASHAMEEQGGTLEVSLHKTELSSQNLITEPNLYPGTYVRLSVRDTGIGLTPEIIDKIFDPYFTTKEVGKGSGMGLAVVQGIVKNHGGFVKVESELGKGSTFNVFFPRIEEEITSEHSEETEDISTGTERILFVDDEEMLADIGKTMLERLGYFVTAKTDSSEALQLFKNDPAQFDLIITDQTMPNIPGSELAKQFLQIRGDIPIILCTGYSSMINEVKAQKIGIREYTMKPVNKNVIARLIRKVLDENET